MYARRLQFLKCPLGQSQQSMEGCRRLKAVASVASGAKSDRGRGTACKLVSLGLHQCQSERGRGHSLSSFSFGHRSSSSRVGADRLVARSSS